VCSEKRARTVKDGHGISQKIDSPLHRKHTFLKIVILKLKAGQLPVENINVNKFAVIPSCVQSGLNPKFFVLSRQQGMVHQNPF
jgi:hypothetical protein